MSYRKTKFVKVLEPIKKGAYFYFTIAYGIFYICGAIAGYVRDKSNLCLGVSGTIGVVFILLGKNASSHIVSTPYFVEASTPQLASRLVN